MGSGNGLCIQQLCIKCESHIPSFCTHAYTYTHSLELEKKSGAPDIHCSCIRGSPGFLGNLKTTAILVHVALLNHGSCYIYLQPCLFVWCALSKVGKPRMALKDRTTDGNAARLYGKDVLV